MILTEATPSFSNIELMPRNKTSRVSVCDIPVDALTMDQTVTAIANSIEERKFIHHVVINAAKVVEASRNEALRSSITECDIINADGQAIVWASRFLNNPVPERVAGIDLMQNLVRLAHTRGYKVFLFGATEEVVAKLASLYVLEYGSNIIGGYRNGYYQGSEEDSVAEQIASSGADLLFVAMTSPKKEIFLQKYKDRLNIPFIMGVGGSFDVLTGKTKRAPLWMQNLGLEWFYRVIQEPRRMWKRYLFGNIQFIRLVLLAKFQRRLH